MIESIKYMLNYIKVSGCIFLYVAYINEEREAREREKKEKIKIKATPAVKMRSDNEDTVVS
jgi:large-conductance mechanosensitive channel